LSSENSSNHLSASTEATLPTNALKSASPEPMAG